MYNTKLTLTDDQFNTLLYLMDEQIINNPRMDFDDWLQMKFNDIINPFEEIKNNHIRDLKLSKAYQMVDLDIVDKMQEIIDVIKKDPAANYTISVDPIKIDPIDGGGIGVIVKP